MTSSQAVRFVVNSSSSSSGVENKVEMDSLEMRIRELESSIYGERWNKGGKVVKVSPGSVQVMTQADRHWMLAMPS